MSFGKPNAGIQVDQWPMCAVCNKPVEELSVHEDFLSDIHVFIARCHGETDRGEVFRMDLANRARVILGPCFVGKRLPVEPKRRCLP